MAAMTETNILPATDDPTWRMLASFDLVNEPGQERLVSAPAAAAQVMAAVSDLHWPAATLAQMERAVMQAAQNVLERAAVDRLVVRLFVRVAGGTAESTASKAGCGWGFFLVQKGEESDLRPTAVPQHVIEIFLYQE